MDFSTSLTVVVKCQWTLGAPHISIIPFFVSSLAAFVILRVFESCSFEWERKLQIFWISFFTPRKTKFYVLCCNNNDLTCNCDIKFELELHTLLSTSHDTTRKLFGWKLNCLLLSIYCAVHRFVLPRGEDITEKMLLSLASLKILKLSKINNFHQYSKLRGYISFNKGYSE